MSKSTTKFANCGFEDFLCLEAQEKARDALRNRKRTTVRRKNKKTNPQKKMRQYFTAKKNVQGYPMRLCKYQPSEGEHMYHPPGHGKLHGSSCLYKLSPASYCKHCKLEPCISVEYSEEMFTMGAQMVVGDGKSESDAGAVISEELQKKHSKLFKLRYSKRRSMPTQCMLDFVSRHYSDPGAESDSDSDEEYELLFGSTATKAASVCHKTR